jgi:hypothetical protein
MPTTNYDSSYITKRRQAMALYAYNNVLQAGINAGTTVRSEQPTLQSGEVIIDRRQGGCFCNDINVNGNVYVNGPGGCGCGTGRS